MIRKLLPALAILLLLGATACAESAAEPPTQSPAQSESVPVATLAPPLPDLQTTVDAAVAAALAGLPTATPPQGSSATPPPTSDVQSLIDAAVAAALAGLEPPPVPDQAVPNQAASNQAAPIAPPISGAANAPEKPATGAAAAAPAPRPPATRAPIPSSGGSTSGGSTSSGAPVSSVPPTQTPVPVVSPTQTPPTPTPLPLVSNTASTGFNLSEVVLTAIGSTVTIAVEANQVEAAVDGVQINVQHPAALQVSAPNCAGIFLGGIVVSTVPVAGGTLFGCFLLSGDVSGVAGEIMTFDLTRVGEFTQSQVISFGISGPAGTQFSNAGQAIDPGTTNELIALP